MNKKDIEKLFPPLPTGLNQDQAPGDPPTVEWRGNGALMRRTGTLFGHSLEITAHTASLGNPAKGNLKINGRVIPCPIGYWSRDVFRSLGITTKMMDPLRVVGSPDFLGALKRTHGGKGNIWLASGREFVLESRSGRPVLYEHGLVVARHSHASTDAEAKAGIIERTWLSPKLRGDEGIVVATLLVLSGWSFE